MGKSLLNFFKVHKIILFLIITFLFGLEFFIFLDYSYISVSDISGIYVPRNYLFAQHIKDSGLSYWTPEIAMGVDRSINDIQVWHISTLFFYLFSPQLAILLLYFMCFFLASYFMFKLLYEIFELSFNSSILGSLFFLTYLTVSHPWFVVAYCILPVICYFLSNISHLESNKKYFLVIFLSLLTMVFTGFALTLPYILTVIFIFLLIENKFPIFTLFSILIFLSTSILLYSSQFQIMNDIAQLSSRALDIKVTGIYSYITSVIKMLKMIAIPMLVGLFVYFLDKKESFLNRRNKNWLFWSFVCILFVTFLGLLEFQRFPIFIFLLKQLSGVSIGRLSFVIPFFMVIIIGISINSLPEKYGVIINKYFISIKKILFYLLLFFIIYVFLSTKINAFYSWAVNGQNFSLTKNQDLLDLFKDDSGIYRVAVIGDRKNSFQSGIVQTYGFETFGGESTFASKRYNDFRSFVYKGVCEDYSSTHFGPSGMNKADCFEQLVKTNDIQDFINIDLLGLANVKYIFSLYPLKGDPLKLISGVDEDKKYTSQLLKIKNKISEAFTSRPIFIYENLKYQERFFFTNSIGFYKNLDELSSKIGRVSSGDIVKKAYVSSEYIELVKNYPKEEYKTSEQSKYEINVIKYTPDIINIIVKNENPGMLVVSNNYSPNWHVKVQGKNTEKKIIPVYGNFWGVFLEEGTYNVEFFYKN